MTWLLYGAYGYTGELIAREAAARKIRPVLAGRNEAKLRPLAEELQLKHRAFSLDEPDLLSKHLEGCAAVLNCAGPFSKTAEPMMEACLAAGLHYLDITGELEVIEAAAARDDQAKEAGVVLMPAVGFDVVPTDCLAAMLHEKMPDATHLQLALAALPDISRGTSRTMAEMLPAGGRVRRSGKIIRVPLAHKSQSITFADRRRKVVTMPWGDVSSAYYSTGIENIEVYFALPKQQIKWLTRIRWMLPAFGIWPLSALLTKITAPRNAGPSLESRQSQRAQLWGKVHDEQGNSTQATMTTPNGYALTVETALAAVERITSADGAAGFQTPSRLFGSDFILQFENVTCQLPKS